MAHSACSSARNAIHSATLALPEQIYRAACRRVQRCASVRLDLWPLRFCPSGMKRDADAPKGARCNHRDQNGPPCSIISPAAGIGVVRWNICSRDRPRRLFSGFCTTRRGKGAGDQVSNASLPCLLSRPVRFLFFRSR